LEETFQPRGSLDYLTRAIRASKSKIEAAMHARQSYSWYATRDPRVVLIRSTGLSSHIVAPIRN